MLSADAALQLFTDRTYDDWIVLSLLLSFFLTCLVIGVIRSSLSEVVSFIFKLNTKDNDIPYTYTGAVGNMLIMFQAAVTFGSYTCVFTNSNELESLGPLRIILLSAVGAILFMALKILAYNSVNKILYSKKQMPTPPSLWAGFYMQAIFIFSSIILLISAITYLFGVPIWLSRIIIVFLASFIELSVIIKSFSVFFRKNIGLLKFFIYLCALEFAPVVLAWWLFGYSR